MAPEAICSVPIRSLDPAGSPLALLLKAEVGTGEGLVSEVWEGLQRAGEAGGSQTHTVSDLEHPANSCPVLLLTSI